MGLPDGEEITTLAFFVFAQYRRVTDGQTDKRTDRHVAISITRASIASHAARVKTVEVRVVKFSPYGSPVPLVFVG